MCRHENTGGGLARPMVVFTCLLIRRRIGAYLDGALENGAARSIARHLSRCARCQGEAENIRRIRALLQRTMTLSPKRAEPDWSGFWPTIVRGIQDAKHRKAPAAVVARRSWWWRPRLTLGGAPPRPRRPDPRQPFRA